MENVSSVPNSQAANANHKLFSIRDESNRMHSSERNIRYFNIPIRICRIPRIISHYLFTIRLIQFDCKRIRWILNKYTFVMICLLYQNSKRIKQNAKPFNVNLFMFAIYIVHRNNIHSVGVYLPASIGASSNNNICANYKHVCPSFVIVTSMCRIHAHRCTGHGGAHS